MLILDITVSLLYYQLSRVVIYLINTYSFYAMLPSACMQRHKPHVTKQLGMLSEAFSMVWSSEAT